MVLFGEDLIWYFDLIQLEWTAVLNYVCELCVAVCDPKVRNYGISELSIDYCGLNMKHNTGCNIEQESV